MFLRQIDLENYVGKALEGAGESDSDSSGDESNPDEEDDSGAAPGFAPTADAAEEDFGAPAADDAGPDIPDAGLEPAPVPATADAPAPAAAPAPAFTLSPRLVDLQLPRAMKEILQKRQQASQQERNKKGRFEMAASRDALSREPPATLRLQACTAQPRVHLGMLVANRADALLLAHEYLEYNWALRKR